MICCPFRKETTSEISLSFDRKKSQTSASPAGAVCEFACATSEEIGQNPIHFCDSCGFKILELLESAVKHTYIFQISVLLSTRIQNGEKS